MKFQVRVIPTNVKDSSKAALAQKVINHWLDDEKNSDMVIKQIVAFFLEDETSGLEKTA